MMEALTGLPRGTIGFQAAGEVTADDYRIVLVPAIDQALMDNKKIRLLFELGTDYRGYEAGALWQDTKLGLGHWSDFEKVAVVTDVEWIRDSVRAFKFLMPAEVQVFGLADEDRARQWLIA
ncbi:STAS/SEC14 domain-containing protein [Nonomuraea soli]|uniref:STAS/SEC14 domain-containing protein n=1 Tax=Nonomuraea soli TaxID=1032476 RepID=A0A7W0CIG0_9ACTN|nr:STAS/SEC14 domain-containing protein [Nonomuraea soli]MBA2891736.1 hypothetical protein [Nonomuraea soli]